MSQSRACSTVNALTIRYRFVMAGMGCADECLNTLLVGSWGASVRVGNLHCFSSSNRRVRHDSRSTRFGGELDAQSVGLKNSLILTHRLSCVTSPSGNSVVPEKDSVKAYLMEIVNPTADERRDRFPTLSSTARR